MVAQTSYISKMKDNYRDHSDLLIPPDTRRVGRGCFSNPFPNMLHAILIASESEGTMDIMSWRPHGRAFRIHKRDAFCEQILPQYFKQSKITSFQRQLNLYGFLRISRGPDAGAYYHDYFLRGRKGLCVHIRRTKIKGTRIKAMRNPADEPNFYRMPFVVSQEEMDGNHDEKDGFRRQQPFPCRSENTSLVDLPSTRFRSYHTIPDEQPIPNAHQDLCMSSGEHLMPEIRTDFGFIDIGSDELSSMFL